MSVIDEAYSNAIKVLEHCAKPTGFYASGLPGGYEATWARDSMITSLGAGLIGDKFKDAFGKSLELLAKNQSALGQIPNAVGSYNIERQSDVTFNSIDSTLWYLIGHHVYKNVYQDDVLFSKYQESRKRALLWLKYQDPNEDTLLTQQPTMDWQDAFPHKYGRVISTQALYYAVLRLEGENARAEHVKDVVSGRTETYLSLYDTKLGYYLPWIWKTHNKFREEGRWFDTFGNLLAIIVGLANDKIAENILNFIEKEKIDKPYPCKAIYPPIKRGSKDWHDYFDDCEARTPYHYLNGGIWPFLGGFYAAALVKAGRLKEAEQALESAAQANKLAREGEWGFHEWIHGKTGKIAGGSNPYQAWTAGTYIWAYNCVKEKKVLHFSNDEREYPTEQNKS